MVRFVHAEFAGPIFWMVMVNPDFDPHPSFASSWTDYANLTSFIQFYYNHLDLDNLSDTSYKDGSHSSSLFVWGDLNMGSSESHLRWALYEQPIYQMDRTEKEIKLCVNGDWMIFFAVAAGPSRVRGHACHA